MIEIFKRFVFLCVVHSVCGVVVLLRSLEWSLPKRGLPKQYPGWLPPAQLRREHDKYKLVDWIRWTVADGRHLLKKREIALTKLVFHFCKHHNFFSLRVINYRSSGIAIMALLRRWWRCSSLIESADSIISPIDRSFLYTKIAYGHGNNDDIRNRIHYAVRGRDVTSGITTTGLSWS